MPEETFAALWLDCCACKLGATVVLSRPPTQSYGRKNGRDRALAFVSTLAVGLGASDGLPVPYRQLASALSHDSGVDLGVSKPNAAEVLALIGLSNSSTVHHSKGHTGCWMNRASH